MGIDNRGNFTKVTGFFKDKTAKKISEAISESNKEFVWMEKSYTFIPFRKVWYVFFK